MRLVQKHKTSNSRKQGARLIGDYGAHHLYSARDYDSAQ